ncbi:MAG: DotA/TraY family protein [Rhodospirillales bacterium]|nr:DotA/TraY family protein [Rhodospirillales bacterium]
MRDFAQNGFGWLAHLMALLYYTVRLLPPGHPYLNASNIGRFGIRHVITEAANNLVIKKENIDQIAIFLLLILGFILLISQFVLLIWGFLIQPAFAQLFTTVNPTNDIAFMLLDRIFAIPNLYNSAFDPNAPGNIPPFNQGLHVLLEFYSLAMLIVAVLIFLYFVMVVVAETAQTGTPFGKRFSHIWAPIRLVVALGLLVPINYGLNSAQYITLFAAKLGSGFATNGWVLFNNTLTNGFGMDDERLVAPVEAPDVQDLVKFMSIARACKELYQWKHNKEYNNPVELIIEPYLVKDALSSTQITPGPAPDYATARGFYDEGDIIIRFGEDGKGKGPGGTDKYPRDTGGVKPICGDIKVHVTSIDPVAGAPADRIQEEYYKMVLQLWEDLDFIKVGRKLALQHLSIQPAERTNAGSTNINDHIVSTGDAGEKQLPNDNFKQANFTLYQGFVKTNADIAYLDFLVWNDFTVPADLLERGWAGAGIWYNHVAEWNGALYDAVKHYPTPMLLPSVMEEVKEQRRKSNENASVSNMYQPNLKDGKSELEDEDIARALSALYQYWLVSDSLTPTDEKLSGNWFFDLVMKIFSIDGLVDMRNGDMVGGVHTVHPLAQLVAVGKSIIDSAVFGLMGAMAFSAAGGFLGMMNPHLGGAVHAVSGLFVSFTSIGLTVGFMLYYVLPFLPFMYFFFAVGSWVKSIFEAMVGVPLWALAHLRIDGNGLPGETALNGYFLIFEIFIRPILTVFGLLAGLIIFTAMVRTLNGIFDLVLLNMSGFGEKDPLIVGAYLGLEMKRGAADEFFFTLVYAIVVYMMATASFKMIDMIPKSILRWMGAGVSSFGDQRDDPTEGLVQYAAIGGARMSQQAVGVMVDGAKLAGQVPGAVVSGLAGRNTGRTTLTNKTP